MIEHLQQTISANLVSFARLLRDRGVAVGPVEQRDALQALSLVDLADLEIFRNTLRTTLAKAPEERTVFDELFEAFWIQLIAKMLKEPAKTTVRPSLDAAPKPQTNTAIRSIKDWLDRTPPPPSDDDEHIAYSPQEVLTRKDFSLVSPEEADEIARLIPLLARPLAMRHSRRYQRTTKTRHLDLRRAIRLNLRRGGELIDLAYRRRRKERLSLVMLCDVSQSMDLYTRFLLPFVFAFQRVYRRVETFVFSTRLHCITPLLKTGPLREALDALPHEVPDWGGGTRIGTALRTFLDDHGTGLSPKTVVLILSDGWDTGELDVLEDAMQEIHRRAHRVLWLNPLMGHPGYEPRTGGMQAALPYIDYLIPAHNVDSLRQAVQHFVRLR